MTRQQLRQAAWIAIEVAVCLGAFWLLFSVLPRQDADVISTVQILVGPLLGWLGLIVFRRIRYRRWVLAMALASFAWYAAFLLPAGARTLVQVLLVGGYWVAMAWPERVGLFPAGSAQAHNTISAVAAYLGGSELDPARMLDLARSLERGRFAVATGDWAATATLFRQVLVLKAAGDDSTIDSAAAFRFAAGRFWSAAVDRGLFVGNVRTDAWDDWNLLRCYHEAFNDLIPRAALAPEPLVPLGGWDDAAEALISEARTIPFGVPESAEFRDELVAMLTDELAFARGERSQEITDRRAFAETRVRQSGVRFDAAAKSAAARKPHKVRAV